MKVLVVCDDHEDMIGIFEDECKTVSSSDVGEGQTCCIEATELLRGAMMFVKSRTLGDNNDDTVDWILRNALKRIAKDRKG